MVAFLQEPHISYRAPGKKVYHDILDSVKVYLTKHYYLYTIKELVS